MKARIKYLTETDKSEGYKFGDILNVKLSGDLYIDEKGWFWGADNLDLKPTDTHYNNENGSLYLFAEHHGLNAWEFDIIKRITRCRKKGQFIEDLEKTKRVIDLYIKEYDTTANR